MIPHPAATPDRGHRVCVIGAGYVGLTAAACLAHLGHEVVCVESDPRRLATLERGGIPIVEPGLDEMVAAVTANGHLTFAARAEGGVPGAEVALLCVGTPPRPDGDPDLTYIAQAAREVSQAATGDLVVVVKSTVPPGSCEAIELICQEAARPGIRIRVASSPEFLRESRAVEDFLHPDRVVVGAADDDVADLVAALYPPGVPVVRCDRRGAELVKYAANAFLAVKISFANEVAALCEHLGTEASTVLQGVGLDHRIGSDFLRPGPGYGGSCLPKDVSGFRALGRAMDSPTHVVAAAERVNSEARSAIVEKLAKATGGVRGLTVAVLGMSFKEGTDDTRDSPGLGLIDILTTSGATVKAYDPLAKVDGLTVERSASAMEAVRDADAVVVATSWREFAELDPGKVAEAMSGDVVIDSVGALDLEKCAGAGLVVYGVGRGTPVSFHPVVWPPLRWAHSPRDHTGSDGTAPDTGSSADRETVAGEDGARAGAEHGGGVAPSRHGLRACC